MTTVGVTGLTLNADVDVLRGVAMLSPVVGTPEDRCNPSAHSHGTEAGRTVRHLRSDEDKPKAHHCYAHEDRCDDKNSELKPIRTLFVVSTLAPGTKRVETGRVEACAAEQRACTGRSSADDLCYLATNVGRAFLHQTWSCRGHTGLLCSTSESFADSSPVLPMPEAPDGPSAPSVTKEL